MLHKVVWMKIGGRQLHLIKAAGAFFVFAAVLKLAQSLYELLGSVDIVKTLLGRGWILGPHQIVLPFANEDALGLLLGPTATFLFWVGITFVALLIYQSGKVILPVDEYESKVSEHHRRLILKAVEHHKKQSKK